MFKTLKILKVLLAIWLCRHVIWACHKKHSPHSLSRHGRVNSENSCALWSCARCCWPWFHSRRLTDFVKSLSQCVMVCPILLKRKLQSINFDAHLVYEVRHEALSLPARRDHWTSPGNFTRWRLSWPCIALLWPEEVPAWWCGSRWRRFCELSLCKLLLPSAAWASTDSDWKKWDHHSTDPGIARFCVWHDWCERAWALGRKFWRGTRQAFVLRYFQSLSCRWVDHPTCYRSPAGQFTWLQLCGAAWQLDVSWDTTGI